MKTLVDQLAGYAAYHRDRRNIATHFIGIPMIVVAVAILLARPSIEWAGITVSATTLAVVLTVLYYLALDLRYGIAMAVLFAAALHAGHAAAALPTAWWLTLGIGLFVVGWAFQFVGHHYEGRKPAFVDDLIGLVIGPLFVVAEAGFALGLRREVHAAIESRAGPTRAGAGNAPAH